MEKDIVDLFYYFDKKLAEMMSIQRESLEILNAQDQIARYGLEGYKAKVIQDEKNKDVSSLKESLFERVRNDKELRHPHIKILNFLADQYDLQKNQFIDANFSKIVKECRIGKNKAKEYLDLLIEKALIETRTDGYRVYYRVKQR